MSGYWPRNFLGDFFTQAPTRFVLDNHDGTQTVFIGTGFTYGQGGIPTGGVITRVEQVDITGPTPVILQRITSTTASGNLGTVAAFISTLQPIIQLNDQIFWDSQGLADGPPSILTDTLIRFALTDGTFTEIIGTGFLAAGAAPLVNGGNVTEVRHVSVSGQTVTTLSTVAVANQTLGFVGAAIFDDLFSEIGYRNFFGSSGLKVTAVTEPDYFNGDFGLLTGGAGNDTFVGFANPDGAGAGVSYASAANGVTVDLQAKTATGDGNDTLLNIRHVEGSAFNDTLKGNSLDNWLDGGNGNDTLEGRGGNDNLIGGYGDDILNGGAGTDTAHYWLDSEAPGYHPAGPGVTVNLNIKTAQVTGQGTDTLISIENVTGSELADTLTGNGVANDLFGNAGDDTLRGMGGDDVLVGWTGNDKLDGGLGNDFLIGGAGNDRLTGGGGSDSFQFDEALSAANNKDVITDFSHADDSFILNEAVFTGLAGWNGWSNEAKADAFYVTGSGPRDAEDRLVYNATTGALSYDADGNGAGAAVVFAVLQNKPVDLDFSDFYTFPGTFV